MGFLGLWVSWLGCHQAGTEQSCNGTMNGELKGVWQHTPTSHIGGPYLIFKINQSHVGVMYNLLSPVNCICNYFLQVPQISMTRYWNLQTSHIPVHGLPQWPTGVKAVREDDDIVLWGGRGGATPRPFSLLMFLFLFLLLWFLLSLLHLGLPAEVLHVGRPTFTWVGIKKTELHSRYGAYFPSLLQIIVTVYNDCFYISVCIQINNPDTAC